MLFNSIPSWNLESLLKKGKSFSKYGVSVDIVKIYRVVKKGVPFDVADVEINFPDTLEKGKWEFVGVKVALDEGFLSFGAIPADMKNDNFICDHCHSKRYRKSVIILQDKDTGKYIQVGKSCIKKYIGTLFTVFSSLLYTLDDCLESMQEEERDFSFSLFGRYTHINTFLYCAYEDIMERGYHKRDNFDNVEPTTYTANKRYREYEGDLTKEQLELAEECKRTYIDFVEKKGSSDFSDNVIALLKQNYIDCKYNNMIVFVPTFFINKRKFEIENKAREERKKQFDSTVCNEFIGTVKEKVSARVKLINIHRYESCFNSYSASLTYTYTFMDNEGHLLQWRTAKALELGIDIEQVKAEGIEFTLAGTIKDCNEYKGRCYTVLTRCKVSK